MPPCKKPYNKESLLQLLQYPAPQDIKKVDLPSLVADAFNKELITNEEFKDMGCCEVTTIKRYLYSVVGSQSIRDIIDKYVQACSAIFAAGSIVLNAFLAYCEPMGLLDDPQFIKRLMHQTSLKYIILPFKSQLSGVSNESPVPEFVEFWKAYGHQLRPLYPPNSDLTFVGWDQPLNNLRSRISTNFMTHVCYHFPTRFKRFVVADILDTFMLVAGSLKVNGTTRKVLLTDDKKHVVLYVNKLYNLIETGKQQLPYQDDDVVMMHEIPEDISLLVQEYRAHIGLEEGDPLSALEKKININTTIRLLPFHIKMSRFFISKNTDNEDPNSNSIYMKQHSISPINTYARMYCYIDNRIIDDLVRRNNIRVSGEATIANVFSLTPDAWNRASRAARWSKRKRKKKK